MQAQAAAVSTLRSDMDKAQRALDGVTDAITGLPAVRSLLPRRMLGLGLELGWD